MENTVVEKIPSVNFHLWEPCNMRCKFCFATFQDVKKEMELPKGHLPFIEAMRVVEAIAKEGFQKINFAGGEPTLCPWLPDLIIRAKEMGLTTAIVSNGSQITKEWLNKCQGKLDWIALSIDSINEKANIISGRAIRGKKAMKIDDYKRIAGLIKKYQIKLKINTVVSAVNHLENIATFINSVNPMRWKIFQVLPIKGQNDACIDSFVIDGDNYQAYLNRNKADLKGAIKMVEESNEMMTSSYLMIDPAGRFFDNQDGTYRYSKPILQGGVKAALQSIRVSYDKFISRDGLYEW